jgi:hypothetical protein
MPSHTDRTQANTNPGRPPDPAAPKRDRTNHPLAETALGGMASGEIALAGMALGARMPDDSGRTLSTADRAFSRNAPMPSAMVGLRGRGSGNVGSAQNGVGGVPFDRAARSIDHVSCRGAAADRGQARSRRGRLLLAVLALGMLAACAACDSSTGSTPPPAPAVPTIAGDPLDMTHAAGQPCALARPDQLAQYHLTANGTALELPSTPGHTTPSCGWIPTTTALPSYQAGVDTTSGGLAALYHHRTQIPVFQPTSVSEYPAIHTAASTTALTHGQCTVDVGVANDTLLIVRVTVPNPAALDYPDPCPDADSFAATVIANSEGQAP